MVEPWTPEDGELPGNFVDLLLHKRGTGKVRLCDPQAFSMIGQRNRREVLPHRLDSRDGRSKDFKVPRLSSLRGKPAHQLKKIRGIDVDGQAQTEPWNQACPLSEILLTREKTSHSPPLVLR